MNLAEWIYLGVILFAACIVSFMMVRIGRGEGWLAVALVPMFAWLLFLAFLIASGEMSIEIPRAD